MHMQHPLFLLLILTLLIVVGWAVYNLIATRRQQKHGENDKGVGGKNDPLRLAPHAVETRPDPG